MKRGHILSSLVDIKPSFDFDSIQRERSGVGQRFPEAPKKQCAFVAFSRISDSYGSFRVFNASKSES